MTETTDVYKGVFDNLIDVYHRTDLKGTCILISPSCYEMYGVKSEEVIGTDLAKYYADPADRETLVKKLMEKGRLVDYEVRIRRPDGKLLWVSTTISVWRAEDGTPLGVEGVSRSINAQKLAAIVQKESIQEMTKLALVVKHSSELVNMSDLEGKMTFINPGGTKMLGIEPDEVGDYNIMQVIPAHHVAMVETELLPALLGGGSWEGELQYTNVKTGKLTDVHAMTFIVPDDDGKPLFFANVSHDISERKKHECEMRKLRNLLHNIIDSMPSMLFCVDMDGRIAQWNSRATELTGITAQEAVGEFLEKVMPRLASDTPKIAEAIRSRSTIRDEKRLIEGVDGERRFECITIYPLVTNGIDGAVIRIDDITQRVRSEEMMIQSDKMMSVGGLAAGMAHEINNPLAGILGSLQVIQKRYEDGYKKNEMVAEECGVSLEKMREYREKSKVNYMVELMAEACHRVSKIVNNVLSFSRKQDMESASFHEMSDLLDRVVYIASHDYNLKKKYDFRLIKIVRDYSEVPKVFCVDSMIQQVFFNILQNAAEAMFGSPDPHFVFTITETKEYVCINIADNGPGMPPEVQTRLFEPFYTTKGTQGTGLGLSIAYHIITVNHRGTIEVDSVEGEGTTFTVCLPKRETYG